ncbi:unnamed protein product [Diplocarpon coronariae]
MFLSLVFAALSGLWDERDDERGSSGDYDLSRHGRRRGFDEVPGPTGWPHASLWLRGTWATGHSCGSALTCMFLKADIPPLVYDQHLVRAASTFSLNTNLSLARADSLSPDQGRARLEQATNPAQLQLETGLSRPLVAPHDSVASTYLGILDLSNRGRGPAIGNLDGRRCRGGRRLRPGPPAGLLRQGDDAGGGREVLRRCRGQVDVASRRLQLPDRLQRVDLDSVLLTRLAKKHSNIVGVKSRAQVGKITRLSAALPVADFATF